MSVARNAGIAFIAAALIGCVTRSDLEELKTNQKQIIEKLEKIEKAGPPAQAQRQRPRGPDPQAVYSFQVGESHTKGPDDAWVTLVEISDFQCPFCNRVGPTMKQIEETYGDDVRIVWKHNPLSFHKRALPAAIAAECAGEQGDGMFWKYHDKVFENQKALEDADLESYAKDTGIDMGRWKGCYDEQKYKNKILADQRAAVTLGARGTPAFFINGRFLSGAQPFPAFKQLIDEELKKAKDSGIGKGEYYSKAVEAKGKKSL
ncbi:MAG: thioredoxin domain-containing protein [Myxococcota bacterium]